MNSCSQIWPACARWWRQSRTVINDVSLGDLMNIFVLFLSGGLTDAQSAALQSDRAGDQAAGGEVANEQTVPVVVQSQPVCPWFTCCYS
jgi:hypothetical protein